MFSKYIKLSLAIDGEGDLIPILVEHVRERFPGIIIFDRNEEANRPDSEDAAPFTPQPAYVNVLFQQSGRKEKATVRCFHQHRFFNYDMEETTPGSKRETALINSMLLGIEEMCELPKPNRIQRFIEESEMDSKTDSSQTSGIEAKTESATISEQKREAENN